MSLVSRLPFFDLRNTYKTYYNLDDLKKVIIIYAVGGGSILDRVIYNNNILYY